MKGEFIREKHLKTIKYSKTILPNILKYFGKIKETSETEAWLKKVRLIIFDWVFEVFIIRAFVIYLGLLSLAIILPPSSMILLAEGISILWFLLVELKRDLWRTT